MRCETFALCIAELGYAISTSFGPFQALRVLAGTEFGQ